MKAVSGETNDETFRSPEVMWLAVVCSTATVPVGEVDAFDMDGGVDTEGSGVSKCTVFGEASMLSCIASVRVVTRMLDEVEGTRRLSGVAWIGRERLLSSGGAVGMLSSTGKGACVDESTRSEPTREDEKSAVLSWSCRVSWTSVSEAETS